MAGMDMEKLLQQMGQMQQQMQEAQTQLANETVEASAGGGMVTVTANGAGEIKAIKIDPKAIDPDDPGAPCRHGARGRERSLEVRAQPGRVEARRPRRRRAR